jgi:hypothetical protein
MWKICAKISVLLASAPKRGAPYGMKSEFVKGRQQMTYLILAEDLKMILHAKYLCSVH